jgi:hypothetical protein
MDDALINFAAGTLVILAVNFFPSREFHAARRGRGR